MTQTKQQATNAELFAKWLEENKPHIAMKDKTEYRNKTTAITFICAEHGEYIAQPRTVKEAKYGCRLCYVQSWQLPFEDFVKRAKEIHGDKYQYGASSWNGASKKTKIFCKACNEFFEQCGSDHLRGHGCPICKYQFQQLPFEDFVKSAMLTHGCKYEYDKSSWRGASNKTKIFCKACNDSFEQTGHSHLAGSGCPICYNKSHQLPFEDFIKSAMSTHGCKYEYDKSSWNGSTNKTKIFCRTCQKSFEQAGSGHLAGDGCPVCNAGGGADNEKNFTLNPELANGSCKLYYIKINGSYKIGITKKTLAQRYSGQKFETLLVRETTRLFAWRAEQLILSEFSEHKQKGDIGRGSTECFATDISTLENFHEIFNHDFTDPIK